MLKSGLSAILGAAALLALPGASPAAPGHTSGHSTHSSSHSTHSGGHSTHSGGHYYGGRGFGVGIGLGLYGVGPYSYGPSYYSPSYYSPSYVAPADYVVPSPSTSYYYAPSTTIRPTAAPVMPPASDPTNALIDVRVPADAEIWFDGDKTSQTGSQRTFETPTVPPGKAFTYDVRARWTGADGKVVDLTRSVQFQAGQRVTVDFMRP